MQANDQYCNKSVLMEFYDMGIIVLFYRKCYNVKKKYTIVRYIMTHYDILRFYHYILEIIIHNKLKSEARVTFKHETLCYYLI